MLLDYDSDEATDEVVDKAIDEDVDEAADVESCCRLTKYLNELYCSVFSDHLSLHMLFHRGRR